MQTGIKGGTMHAVNATIASNKPLFAVSYNSQQDFFHEKVQGNIMLIQEKGAHPLRSKDLETAFTILEQARNKYSNTQQQTLF